MLAMCSRRHHPNRQRGVSLIEVVVVVALLGILLAAVLPGIGSWMKSLKVRNAAESVRNGLERARTEALKRNQNVTFWLVSDAAKTLSNACVLSSASASWVVSIADPTGKCDEEVSTTTAPMLVEKYSAAEGAVGVQVGTTGANGATPSSIAFNGFGQVVQTGSPVQTIDFSLSSEGARALRVVIAPGGAVRMCDPAVAEGDSRSCGN
jgi:type IV fimbrial biogenesis protein FimT